MISEKDILMRNGTFEIEFFRLQKNLSQFEINFLLPDGVHGSSRNHFWSFFCQPASSISYLFFLSACLLLFLFIFCLSACLLLFLFLFSGFLFSSFFVATAAVVYDTFQYFFISALDLALLSISIAQHSHCLALVSFQHLHCLVFAVQY